MLSGTFLVARDGEVVHQSSYGMANYELGVPNAAETEFCIASITKPMTALAVARLVYEKRLRLDDPVSTWIADFPSGDTVTLRQLMTHRAGVPHRVTEPDEEIAPMTASDLVDRVKEKGLQFPPGEQRVYSSAGYSVVASIIEITAGKPYNEAMNELVFAPLGMTHTFHVDSRQILEGRADSYVQGLHGKQNAPLKDLSFLVGAGSLYSTAYDVYRFGYACLQRQGFPSGVFDVFTQDLEWMSSFPVRWNGSTNGFASFLDLHADTNTVVVFLGNAGMGRASELRGAIPDIVANNPYEVPEPFPPQVVLTPREIHEYAGSYGADGRQTILKGHDGILVTDGGDVLRSLGGGQFFSPYYGCYVRFQRDDAGTPQALLYLLPDGGNLRLPRR